MDPISHTLSGIYSVNFIILHLAKLPGQTIHYPGLAMQSQSKLLFVLGSYTYLSPSFSCYKNNVVLNAEDLGILQTQDNSCVFLQNECPILKFTTLLPKSHNSPFLTHTHRHNTIGKFGSICCFPIQHCLNPEG